MATNPNSMVQEAVDAAISKHGEIGLQGMSRSMLN